MSARSLSEEQQAIVEAAIGPFSIKACAGSGKTRTAVHRLLKLRELQRDTRGHITLLSFSNVAVDAFRAELLAQKSVNIRIDTTRITVATVDSFGFNVIQPHAKRTMVQAAILSLYKVVSPSC
ncbi:MAG: UvrD-helicase domain-containing protein [Flavobacteriales bacterium]|nr:UvrD-helicase domain-containing protein [Flavobacteriales bacterium]